MMEGARRAERGAGEERGCERGRPPGDGDAKRFRVATRHARAGSIQYNAKGRAAVRAARNRLLKSGGKKPFYAGSTERHRDDNDGRDTAVPRCVRRRKLATRRSLTHGIETEEPCLLGRV